MYETLVAQNLINADLISTGEQHGSSGLCSSAKGGAEVMVAVLSSHLQQYDYILIVIRFDCPNENGFDIMAFMGLNLANYTSDIFPRRTELDEWSVLDARPTAMDSFDTILPCIATTLGAPKRPLW
jgi:hypothetical protein